MADVYIEGLDKLIRKLNSLEGLQVARAALKAGALHVKGKIAVYPPSTAANSPGNVTGRWYERGFGTRWRRKDGSLDGHRTSETLGKKWTIAERMGGLQQVVGNNVSYAEYVQSEEKQASFHRERGWKTDEQVAREEAETVARFVRDEILRTLRKW